MTWRHTGAQSRNVCLSTPMNALRPTRPMGRCAGTQLATEVAKSKHEHKAAPAPPLPHVRRYNAGDHEAHERPYTPGPDHEAHSLQGILWCTPGCTSHIPRIDWGRPPSPHAPRCAALPQHLPLPLCPSLTQPGFRWAGLPCRLTLNAGRAGETTPCTPLLPTQPPRRRR